MRGSGLQKEGHTSGSSFPDTLSAALIDVNETGIIVHLSLRALDSPMVIAFSPERKAARVLHLSAFSTSTLAPVEFSARQYQLC